VKVGFVIPWYGVSLSGGAESECRATALQLKAAGFEVEILTTCVKEFRSDWNVDYYRPGLEVVEGVPVRRFRVRKCDREEFHRVNRRLMDGERLGSQDALAFMRAMIQSDDLLKFMKKSQNQYVYILIPYMFGTTYFGALACPQNSILLPCLHDESYAYLPLFEEMFQKVRGIIYNSRSEMKLAENLYQLEREKGALIGIGMDLDPSGDGARFRSQYTQDPYLLYAGRKDEGKNIQLLLDYFCAYKDFYGGKINLVFIGGGQLEIPFDRQKKQFRTDIIDLGFVSTQDKYDAYAGALALCNPSLNESFSLVMMESWICGTPVLVHEKCEVTQDHCLASQGGLYFGSFEDFAGCLDYFQKFPEQRQRMASNGAEYVKRNFTWPVVIEKYKKAFRQWGFPL
jgi:glycosyltransferase involved in cell wall biosynthesis